MLFQGPGADLVANQDLDVYQTLQGSQEVVKIFQRGQEGFQARVLEVYQAAQQDQEVCDPIQEGCALLLSLHLLLLLQWWQVAFSELY